MLDLKGYPIGEQGAQDLADALSNDVVILVFIMFSMPMIIFECRHLKHLIFKRLILEKKD